MKQFRMGSILLALASIWVAGAIHAAEMDPAGTETEKKVAASFRTIYGVQKAAKSPKASKRGDRVTFLINRKSNYRLQAKTEADNDNSTDVKLDTFFTPELDKEGNLNANPRAGGTGVAGTEGNKKPNIKYSVTREQAATARVERREQFKDKISGQVIDVMPNGQLVVEAVRHITVNAEKITQTLKGRVDPKDLNFKSEIDSDSIIDLQIDLKGKGGVSDVMKRGFVSKLIDKFKMF